MLAKSEREFEITIINPKPAPIKRITKNPTFIYDMFLH